MNKLIKIGFCVFSFLTSSFAFSQTIFTCSTSSNGYFFNDKGRNTAVTSELIVRRCEQHSRTTNVECRANVACDDGRYYSPMTRCHTSSNSYQFTDESRVIQVAIDQVTLACERHSRTTNEECRANAWCEDEYPRPRMISCTTSSNGYNFKEESLDSRVAQRQVKSKCTTHSRTTNVECEANVACNDDSYWAPMVRCDTFSNGYRFVDESRDRYVAQDQTVKACQKHSRTVNIECEANVYCAGDRRSIDDRADFLID